MYTLSVLALACWSLRKDPRIGQRTLHIGIRGAGLWRYYTDQLGLIMYHSELDIFHLFVKRVHLSAVCQCESPLVKLVIFVAVWFNHFWSLSIEVIGIQLILYLAVLCGSSYRSIADCYLLEYLSWLLLFVVFDAVIFIHSGFYSLSCVTKIMQLLTLLVSKWTAAMEVVTSESLLGTNLGTST